MLSAKLDPMKIIEPKDDSEKEQIKSRIWFFLNRADKMILAYINELGEPVQSMMLYAIDDDMNFYFGTLKRFPKYEFLVNNPPLSILVQEANANPKMAVSVKAAIVEEIDGEKLKERLRWFSEKNSCKYYIKDQDDFIMFKAKTLSARLIDGNSEKIIRYDLNILD